MSIFDHIISIKNLFIAWREFIKGKVNKLDVIIFAQNIEESLFKLHKLLKTNRYKHSAYTAFYINDPKKRLINKAIILDRVLHHAVHRIIEPIFEKKFIYDSYSSRKKKGTLKAIYRFEDFAWKLSRNNTKTVWVLKCDIKKFFDTVDRRILINIIKKNIEDAKSLNLVELIINSYEKEKYSNCGIPLGNLTSQLFSNIYLNELDQYLKRVLGIKYYIRYADDFVICGIDKGNLKVLLIKIQEFLKDKLRLKLHINKVSIKKWHSGIDFLGYVIFPHHRILRTRTKQRMFTKLNIYKKLYLKNKIDKEEFTQIINSYFSRLLFCSGRKIKKKIIKHITSI